MTPTLSEIIIHFVISRPQMTIVWVILSIITMGIWCIHASCLHLKPVWRSILTGSWIPVFLAAYILLIYCLEANALHKRLVDPSTKVIRAFLSEDNQITAVIGTEEKTISVEKEILGSEVATAIITPENSMNLSPEILEWLESKHVKIAGEPIGKSAVAFLTKNP